MNYLPTRGLPILPLPGETMEEAQKRHKKTYNSAYRARQQAERDEALRHAADTILGCKHLRVDIPAIDEAWLKRNKERFEWSKPNDQKT